MWLALAATLLSACMGEEEQWLQGSWVRGNTHFVAEWNFNRGAYSYYYDYTNGINPQVETGRYAVVETGEDYLLIELFQRQGSNPEQLEENERYKLTFDLEGGTIKFRGQVYERITP